MLTIRLTPVKGTPAVLALPIGPDGPVPVPVPAPEETGAFLAEVGHSGAAGMLHTLPMPLRRPRRLLLVGVGDGDEAGWRAAGAALARAAQAAEVLSVALPAGAEPGAVRGLAEGLLLASYRFRLTTGRDRRPALRRVNILTVEPDRYLSTLAVARTVAEVTYLARDLTNMPSHRKTPEWFARRVERAAADRRGLRLRVRSGAELAAEGFGGIVAVGGGSVRDPRLVELSWRPRRSWGHVVLVGKGITFDTGGICIKPRDGMKLMRKDMGGAAAIISATLGAAALELPVRVTALAPLAENALGGGAYRPGDVVHHYGGRTSEILNTDAEGRLVLADALAYAAHRLRPDLLVDLATLTGANAVALGKRTAALYSDSDELAGGLAEAARAAGENVWRMPLTDDYLELIGSEVADLANCSDAGAGSVTAALYLREFTGTARDRWAHLDMSAPSWADGADGELVKGATGWGVRTLVRWLEGLAAQPAARLPPPAARSGQPVGWDARRATPPAAPPASAEGTAGRIRRPRIRGGYGPPSPITA